jgi:hypothetical protein
MTSQGVPLLDAGLRLGLTYHQVRNLLLSGQLSGGRDGFGRLYIDPQDVERLLRERRSIPKPARTR